MQVRGVVLISVALFLGIAALVLHLLALCSPHWRITKRDVAPKMEPVSYGLWQRCEYRDTPIIKQGVTLGTRPHVLACWPNVYLRYSPETFNECYNIRRNCPVLQKEKIPKGCACRYLPSDRALQWLTILGAVFLTIGLLLLYLKTIAQPQNDSAVLLLSYAPFICFLLALLLMATSLILIGAFLRRDTYEDYSFPLAAISEDTQKPRNFDLHSLRNYAKLNDRSIPKEKFIEAEKELRKDAHTHYHTVIGPATVYEIIATALLIIVTVFTYWLATASSADN